MVWKSARAASVCVMTAIAMVIFTGPAFASSSACNASFCNTTKGSGGRMSSLYAEKVGGTHNVVGFFEVHGPRGMVATGPTTSADYMFLPDSFRNYTTLKKGELLCLTFFAKTSRGGFVEVGTAQCTTAPFSP
jgi:hypothetical protein